MDGKSNCPICVGESAGDNIDIVMTSCGHIFHNRCIENWKKSSPLCPICRHEFEDLIKVFPPCEVKEKIQKFKDELQKYEALIEEYMDEEGIDELDEDMDELEEEIAQLEENVDEIKDVEELVEDIDQSANLQEEMDNLFRARQMIVLVIAYFLMICVLIPNVKNAIIHYFNSYSYNEAMH